MTKRINLLSPQFSKGLLRDVEVLEGALNRLFVDVTVSRIGRMNPKLGHIVSELASIGYHRIRRFDVNIHVEDLKSRWLGSARQNWWIPNQEWVRPQSTASMHRADIVLCKTRIGQEIFENQKLSTRFLGFTTADQNDSDIPRERRVLHVAGTSPNKGTRTVVSAWQQHPEWPVLDLVWSAPAGIEHDLPANVELHRSPVSEQWIRRLQNRATFHVCPSAVEGFGHTLVEAMSCGACVITTHAPPMNEMVEADRGILLSYNHTEPAGLATAYHVTAAEIARGIETALALSEHDRLVMSERARAWFLANDATFRDRLQELVEDSIA